MDLKEGNPLQNRSRVWVRLTIIFQVLSVHFPPPCSNSPFGSTILGSEPVNLQPPTSWKGEVTPCISHNQGSGPLSMSNLLLVSNSAFTNIQAFQSFLPKQSVVATNTLLRTCFVNCCIPLYVQFSIALYIFC